MTPSSPSHKGSSRVVTGLMTAFMEAIFETGERVAEANGGLIGLIDAGIVALIA